MAAKTGIRQWYYRGSLQACNYDCSYCPFSKRPKISGYKLEQDEQVLVRFVNYMIRYESSTHCAVQIVPYGEALIHTYYWREMARLSKKEYIDAVGAQTNMSFPVDKMVAIYQKEGGRIDKLRLWGTFHPQQTSVEDFCAQCDKIEQKGILFCVGAVGVPEEIEQLKKLRACLPKNVYMWINKMDGLKKPYSNAQRQAFAEIDDYFFEELRQHKADAKKCADSCFVEADGTKSSCVICKQGNAKRQERSNLYQSQTEHLTEFRACVRKNCSCYLAYCNQKDPNSVFFQPYPAFRIPTYPKAVFFDIDGTLVHTGRGITEDTAQKLRRLAKHSDIYLATSLPYKDALRSVKPVADQIAGGVFAAGGLLRYKEHDSLLPLPNKVVNQIKIAAVQNGFQVRCYQRGEEIYKLTLIKPSITKKESIFATEFDRIGRIIGILDDSGRVISPEIATMVEGNYLQIVSSKAGKVNGILHICAALGYRKEEIAVFGNSESDIPMLQEFPFSVAINPSKEAVKKAATYQYFV